MKPAKSAMSVKAMALSDAMCAPVRMTAVLNAKGRMKWRALTVPNALAVMGMAIRKNLLIAAPNVTPVQLNATAQAGLVKMLRT